MANSSLLLRVAGALGWRRDAPGPPAPRAAGGATGGATGGAGARPAAGSPATPGLEDIESRLHKLLQHQPNVVAGRVNFIGLEKIRDELGERWPRLAQRVDGIARRAIERHLDRADFYMPFSELQYLVVFAELGEEAGQLKCALIAAEITERLLGPQFGGSALQVRTMVRTIDGALELRDVDPTAEIASRMAAGAAEPSAPDKPDRGTADDTQRSTPGGRIAGDDGLGHAYRPIWDVRRDAVATYRCIRRDVPGGAPGATGADGDGLYHADMSMLVRVINDLRALAAARRQLLLVSRVHFETLARNKHRVEFVRLCQTVPETQQRLLIFDIVEPEDGVSPPRLIELVSYLKPYARMIVLSVPLARTRFLGGRETGAGIVGTNAALPGAGESELIDAINRFAEGAARARLQSYVYGLHTHSLASAAVAAGCDYVSGDVIHPLVDRIGDVHRFNIANLYDSGRRRDDG